MVGRSSSDCPTNHSWSSGHTESRALSVAAPPPDETASSGRGAWPFGLQLKIFIEDLIRLRRHHQETLISVLLLL